ncbi:hypothetical protein NW759_009201 [Fusarium solani]|nr:hypothetical protein NW759_009201 [Fusarium solani]
MGGSALHINGACHVMSTQSRRIFWVIFLLSIPWIVNSLSILITAAARPLSEVCKWSNCRHLEGDDGGEASTLLFLSMAGQPSRVADPPPPSYSIAWARRGPSVVITTNLPHRPRIL